MDQVGQTAEMPVDGNLEEVEMDGGKSILLNTIFSSCTVSIYFSFTSVRYKKKS